MSYRSPLLSRHGAVAAEGVDSGVASHYGDPLREQRELSAGRAVADLSHRGVVTISGPDRLSWLTTLSSQQLSGLTPGGSAEALLLSVQGRIEHDLRVVDDGERSWLIVEAAEAAPLTAFLDRMRFMLRVEVADVSEEWAVLGSTVPLPGLSAFECTAWADPWPRTAPGGYSYALVADEAHPGMERPWFERLVRRAALETALTVVEAEGFTLAGSSAVEALRIAAWRPRLGVETDEKSIPHELDLLRTAVHLAKGCYKGQETVARVHNLGHPPRRLVLLQLDGSLHTLPAVGSEVRFEDRAVGRVTSTVLHHEMGPIALAMVKRSTDSAATLSVVDGGEVYAAAQEAIVAPDAGQTVGRQTGFLRAPR